MPTRAGQGVDARSRRAFLTRMTAAGMGAAALALLTTRPPAWADAAGGADGGVEPFRKGPANGITFPNIPGSGATEKVLNFALTLEILEADLYRQAVNAASGKPLTTPLLRRNRDYQLAVPSGGLDKGTTRDAFEYLVEFARVEAAHRDFIRAVIGGGKGTPVAANPRGYKFPGGPAADLKGILQTNILPLEETGVRAYLGALPALSELAVAQAAAEIYSTEARHSAVIRYLVGQDPGPVKMNGDRMVLPNYPSPNTLEYYLLPAEVLSAASAYFA